MTFLIEDAEAAFRAYAGIDLNVGAARPAITRFLDFYVDEKPRGVLAPQDGGDALLFQWGTYDWSDGHGANFQADITRQFIKWPGGSDDLMSQLHLTLHYPITPATAALGAGEEWFFDDPHEAPFHGRLEDFRSWVLGGDVLAFTDSVTAERVSFWWERI